MYKTFGKIAILLSPVPLTRQFLVFIAEFSFLFVYLLSPTFSIFRPQVVPNELHFWSPTLSILSSLLTRFFEQIA